MHRLEKYGIWIILFLTFVRNAKQYTLKLDQLHRLGVQTWVEIENERELQFANLWNPFKKTRSLADFKLIRQFHCKNFTDKILLPTNIYRKFNSNFLWKSISLLSLKKNSYLLIGGSWKRSNESIENLSVMPNEDGIVVLCTFIKSTNVGFVPASDCTHLTEKIIIRGDVGATVSSMQLSPTLGLLAYCDPIWTGQNEMPAGRCFLQLINRNRIRSMQEIKSLCRTGSTITEPCMSGFSLALSFTNSFKGEIAKNIRVHVGQPLANNFGRTQIIQDPFNKPKIYSVYRPKINNESLPGTYFGYSISNSFITAPGYIEEEILTESFKEHPGVFNVKDYFQGEPVNTIRLDWQGNVPRNSSFSGFGTSSVQLKTNISKTIIVVGAPYASFEGTATNIGAIYLYCLSENHHDENGYQPQASFFNDYIAGPIGSKYFGYSLSAMGDLDGDGIEDLAIGSPNLKLTNGNGGKVFLLRVLPDCSFDRQPYDILEEKVNNSYFGTVLPSRSADLDMNGWPDIIIPTAACDSCVHNTIGEQLTPKLFASRARYYAVCRFEQPLGLSNLQINPNIVISIKLKIRMQNVLKIIEQLNFLEILEYARSSIGQLEHQVNPDMFARKPNEQRLHMENISTLGYDKQFDSLIVKFTLRPQMDIQDMPNLQKSNGAIKVQYRFNIPCPVDSPYSEEMKTCTNEAWLIRPLIDWSNCHFKLKLNRFICFPHDICESSVFLRIVDVITRAFVTSFISSNNATTHKTSGQSFITFGDQSTQKPQLLIELFNLGPTFAGGVAINITYFGNLKFSKIEMGIKDELNQIKYVNTICLNQNNNDSGVLCRIKRIEAPLFKSEKNSIWNITNLPNPQIILRLTSFYNTQNIFNINNTFKSGVHVTVTTETLNPVQSNNTLQWNYIQRHVPGFLISSGLKPPSSYFDNRTTPSGWLPVKQRRVWVNDIGPRLKHTFQVEHTGPSSHLINVTLKIRVPVSINSPVSNETLIYLFDKIRSPLDSSNELGWLSLRPEVKYLGNQNAKTILCDYSSMDLVNPNGIIGVDLNEIAIDRRRRTFEENKQDGMLASTKLNATESEIPLDRQEKTDFFDNINFGRNLKEVIQCDRQGLFGRPTCLEISCNVDELEKHRPVQVTINGWVYARTFFKYSTPDIEIITSITVDQGFVPDGVQRLTEPAGYFELSQTFFFSKIKPKLLRKLPIWPIIVGIVLGILLLSFLICLLYQFGFFKRQKYRLAKSEHVRNGRSYNRGPNSVKICNQNSGFGYPMSTEEARKRRRRIQKHPEEVSILHPNEIKQNLVNQSNDKINTSPQPL